MCASVCKDQIFRDNVRVLVYICIDFGLMTAFWTLMEMFTIHLFNYYFIYLFILLIHALFNYILHILRNVFGMGCLREYFLKKFKDPSF